MRFLLSAILTLFAAGAIAAPPAPLASFGEKPVFAQLRDGTLIALFSRSSAESAEVRVRRSTDAGVTWTEEETLLALDPKVGGWTLPEALVDREGALHLFFLNDEGTGVVLNKPGSRGDRKLCIWHAKSPDGRTQWTEPKRIWEGYTGALNSVIQMTSGRILLPFSCLTKRRWSDRGEGLDTFTYRGQFDSTLVYSDDGGDTWTAPPVRLKAPTPDIVSAYGAVEPVVIQLKSGRVWMLIRTQQGRFYESFSDDGATWSTGRPGAIESSDSPAGIVRVPDGRLVLLWNNCLRYPYAHGGRHVLHAAVSADEGRTWFGYREIARDSLRDQPPPPRGDHGTAYPFPIALQDGRVLFSTGQGEAERVACMVLEPDWLRETRQVETFEEGIDDWSSFGTRGVGVVADPTGSQPKVLSLQKTEREWPACAVWNFPAGSRGTVRLRLRMPDTARGIHIGLTDHFSTPFDEEDVFHNVYNLVLDEAGRVGGAPTEWARDAWHTLELTWNNDENTCAVSIDGAPVAALDARRGSPGIGYVRIKSAAGGLPLDESVREAADPRPDLDPVPCLIASVEADVSAAFEGGAP